MTNGAAETPDRDLLATYIREQARLHRCISMAMGCLDPESKNRDERLAWYRLFDAQAGNGKEPRPCLPEDDVPLEKRAATKT